MASLGMVAVALITGSLLLASLALLSSWAVEPAAALHESVDRWYGRALSLRLTKVTVDNVTLVDEDTVVVRVANSGQVSLRASESLHQWRPRGGHQPDGPPLPHEGDVGPHGGA